MHLHFPATHSYKLYTYSLENALESFAHPPLNDFYWCFFVSVDVIFNWNFLFEQKCTWNYHVNRCAWNIKSNDSIQFLRTSIIIVSKQNYPESSLLEIRARASFSITTLLALVNHSLFSISLCRFAIHFKGILTRCLFCCAFFWYKSSIYFQIEYLHWIPPSLYKCQILLPQI